jgi:hypothetical protein
MSIAEKYGQLIDRRKQIDHIDFDHDPVIVESIALLTENIDLTIHFLENECTGDQFTWMSEIFDEIVEKTQSRSFIECLYRTAERFPTETKEYNIIRFIQSAEEFLMNLYQLELVLQKSKIPKDAYSLKGGLPNEQFCISHENGKWEVYYSERGNKTSLKIFDFEEIACNYFLDWIKRSFNIR